MTKETLSFVLFIIHKLSSAWSISPREVYKILKKTNCIQDYIILDYDVLHTLGAEYLVTDITEYVRRKGGIV